MSYTEFGEYFRILRIKHHEVLNDAKKFLGVSTAFISSVECGKKKIPDDWENKIIMHYNLNEKEQKELRNSIEKSRKELIISWSEASTFKKDITLQFQRSFDDLDDETMTEIQKILEKKEEAIMDFRTKKLNREKIRKIAKIIKKEIFKSKDIYYFDVIYALEKLPILYDNVRVEIIDDEDSEIFSGAPSSIRIEDDGTYVIYIKQKVYEKAADNENGGYRMHIMHEICHYFLFSMDYTPFFDRTYKNKDLKPFESIERQAKALAGEILIPYDDTINFEEIMSKCKVSKDAAMYRIKLDKEVLNDK